MRNGMTDPSITIPNTETFSKEFPFFFPHSICVLLYAFSFQGDKLLLSMQTTEEIASDTMDL